MWAPARKLGAATTPGRSPATYATSNSDVKAPATMRLRADMTPLIRPAQLADIPALMAIRNTVDENRLSDPSKVTFEGYVECITVRGAGWVAVADDAIVGFAVGTTDGNLWALFLRKSYEGQGLGRALLAEAVAWFATRGVERATLTTEPGTRAERLYELAGWRREGVAPNGDVEFVLDLPK